MITLGYPGMNMTLTEQNIRTSRGIKKATWNKHGIEKASEVALLNVKDLLTIVKWNTKNNINFFRMSSMIFPWMSQYKFEDLPDFKEIENYLKLVGSWSIYNNQRLSFHPGQFNCLGSPNENVVKTTYLDLNQHSRIFDLMGLKPSTWNKINIHVGGSYGDKKSALERWVDRFQGLDDNTKKRLTIENDDKAGGYNVEQLMPLAQQSDIPIVFDYHHHECYNDGLPEQEAFELAYSTWKDGIIPALHKSSKRDIEKGSNPRPHHDFINEEFNNYNKPVYVMLEAKQKELALFKYKKQFLKT